MAKPAWIVAYTVQDGKTMSDFWSVYPSRKEAQAMYDAVSLADNVYCASYGQMKDATEPHWLTGNL